MADENKPTGEAEAKPVVSPRWRVDCDNDSYNGHHPNGLQFMGGMATTDDAEKAALFKGLGFAIVDLQKVADREAAKAAKK